MEFMDGLFPHNLLELLHDLDDLGVHTLGSPPGASSPPSALKELPHLCDGGRAQGRFLLIDVNGRSLGRGLVVKPSPSWRHMRQSTNQPIKVIHLRENISKMFETTKQLETSLRNRNWKGSSTCGKLTSSKQIISIHESTNRWEQWHVWWTLKNMKQKHIHKRIWFSIFTHVNKQKVGNYMPIASIHQASTHKQHQVTKCNENLKISDSCLPWPWGARWHLMGGRSTWWVSGGNVRPES